MRVQRQRFEASNGEEWIIEHDTETGDVRFTDPVDNMPWFTVHGVAFNREQGADQGQVGLPALDAVYEALLQLRF